MRTLALYWPALSGLADRAERLRSARHALGRLSPLVTGRDLFGLIEVGIDGLQARSGSERDIAAIALRAVGVHLRERPTAAIASSRLLAIAAVGRSRRCTPTARRAIAAMSRSLPLRACSPSMPTSINPNKSLPVTSGESRPSACRALRSRSARSARPLSAGQ